MRTLKFLAVVALSAPLATLSAQSDASTRDSTAVSHSNAAWMTAGATGGAALFAALLHGSGSSRDAFTPASGGTSGFTAATNSSSAPAAGPTVNDATNGDNTTSNDTSTPSTGDQPPAVFNDDTPNDPGSNDPVVTDNNPDVTTPSTVPEPASLALLGTGLVGLVPLVRRRK